MKNLIFLMLAGLLLLSTGCGSSEAQTSTPEASGQEVKQTIDAFGIVKSNDVKDIIIDFPAMVEGVSIKDGQKVEKGDVLFTLNYNEYKNQISAKEIELNSTKLEMQNSKLELDKLKRDLAELQWYLNNGSHPDLSKLSNDLTSAKKQYEDSLEELKSKEDLFKSGSISEFELESFKRSVDANKKAVNDINAAIERARYSLKKETSQLKLLVDQKSSSSGTNGTNIYEEKILALENTIKIMKDKINKSYIIENNVVCDMDNAIAYDLGYVKGESTNPAKKLLSLMSFDSMIIESTIPEEFIKDVKQGSQVTIIPQADKSRKYTGKVTYMANKAIQRNGETTVLIQVSIDDNDGFLLPNFNADLEISMD